MTKHEEELENIKTKLRIRRRELGLTQVQAAELADIKPLAYHLMERQGRNFEIRTLIKVMVAFGMSFNALHSTRSSFFNIEDIGGMDMNGPIDIRGLKL